MERKLYKTKICVLYRRGNCPRQNCSFAHGEAELRRFSGPPNGRFDIHGGGDLRDRPDRRHSPRRRRSPGFDRRTRRPVHGFNRPRSPRIRSDRQGRKRQRLEGENDVSGDQSVSDESEYHDGKASSYDSKDGVAEQLKEVQTDMKKLEDHKRQLVVISEEKEQETERIASRIRDLEVQLGKEREDSKRIKSKLTKFVKIHHRHQRAQEDLKRSQVRLQKQGDQLSSDVLRHGGNEDSSVSIVSDEERNGGDGDGLSPQRDPSNLASSSKRALQLQPGAFGEGKAVITKKRDASISGTRLEKLTQLDEASYQANVGDGSALTPILAGEISLRVQERKNNQIRGRNASPKNSSFTKYEEDEEVDVDGLGYIAPIEAWSGCGRIHVIINNPKCKWPGINGLQVAQSTIGGDVNLLSHLASDNKSEEVFHFEEHSSSPCSKAWPPRFCHGCPKAISFTLLYAQQEGGGFYPLHLAARAGHFKLVLLLTSAELLAQVNGEELIPARRMRNCGSNIALHEAVKIGNEEVICSSFMCIHRRQRWPLNPASGRHE